ncbi:MAG: electron transfer flavoprotein subunit alpha/FixB family protein [Nitriliruptoraceae bacterium]
MTATLVIVEVTDAGVAKSSLEAITFTRTVTEGLDGVLSAVSIGAVPAAARDALASFGVTSLVELVGDIADTYAPAAWAAAVVTLIHELQPQVVAGAGSQRGSEILAHVAAIMDEPLAAQCVALEAGDGGWDLTRIRWGGVLFEDAYFDAERAIVTVAPHHTAAASAASSGQLQVDTRHVVADPDDLTATVQETRQRDGGVSLATAAVVIAGGRGVGSAEGFAELEELAGLLGGAVGCSRVATNNGWRSHNDQVGQTGTRVAPDLYVACGISGATQHWVGCMSAKQILAINTDNEAPLVAKADYAVIGDLHTVLPAIIEEVKARKVG